MKILRTVLFPFSVLYGWITDFRNFLYDRNVLESKKYAVPIVSVGNLSTGGTGKSPMIEYLISFLKNDYKIAVLSRGYKRKTKGFLEVKSEHSVEEVGDEPLQFKLKYPDVTVAVCADRRTGIEKLKKTAELILLDDAFQHRKVKPDYSILLTSFNNLFIEDFILPTGNLRETRKGSKRADMLIVTKCPERVPYAKLQEIEFRLPIYGHQKLYFSKIGYSETIISKSEKLPLNYLQDKSFTLVTGIANPQPLLDYLNSNNFKFEHLQFSDHHNFSTSEIKNIEQQEIVLTTEKDYMRLKDKVDKFALYYLPITTEILKEQAEFLEETVDAAIKMARH